MRKNLTLAFFALFCGGNVPAYNSGIAVKFVFIAVVQLYAVRR